MYNLSKLAAGVVIAAAAALGGASAVLADGYTSQGEVVYERPPLGAASTSACFGWQWSDICCPEPVVSTGHRGQFTTRRSSAHTSGCIISSGASCSVSKVGGRPAFRNNPGTTPCVRQSARSYPWWHVELRLAHG